MYSYEDRLRAVRLYIKLGRRTSLTIRQLGYPTNNALKAWHREYEQRHDLPASYARQPKYSQAHKVRAGEHYLEHGRCIAATIRSLGYPSRTLLAAWLQDLDPQDRTRVVGRSQALTPEARPPSSPSARASQACRQWLRMQACLEERCTSGRISCTARTYPHP